MTNRISMEDINEYSQRRNRFKKEKNILITIPERPKHLTGDDFAEIHKYYEEYNTKDKKYPDITYHGRPRSLKGDFFKMERDLTQFNSNNSRMSSFEMYRSYNKRYTTSYTGDCFKRLFRYIRNKLFRKNIDDI